MFKSKLVCRSDVIIDRSATYAAMPIAMAYALFYITLFHRKLRKYNLPTILN